MDPTSQRRPAFALLAGLLLAGCATTPPKEAPAPIVSAPAVATPTPTAAQPVPAEASADDPTQAFARWVAAFRTSARKAGISDATLSAAFDSVRYLPQVIEADRAQPEFTRAVWDYLDSAVSPTRIARGQEKLRLWRSQLAPISARYGVPAEVLVAIWGVESSFGSFVGDIPTIDALATLAIDGRREAWARGQLLAALKILQSGDIGRAQMLGSWAGAMGQTQFLPTVYLAHAVDGDGDGRRDIWSSVPDVMASTAAFIAHSGWQAGQAWGAEVRLPADFDHADAERRRTAAEWADKGVRSMDGTPLPDLLEAAILLPAGAHGPAFLVDNNFRTILRYNNATSYALAVNLLAQRLAGGATVQATWPRHLQPLTRTQVLALQKALNDRGFDSGTPDGLAGPATQRALRRYQASLGLPADGFPTVDLLQRLQQ